MKDIQIQKVKQEMFKNIDEVKESLWILLQANEILKNDYEKMNGLMDSLISTAEMVL